MRYTKTDLKNLGKTRGIVRLLSKEKTDVDGAILMRRHDQKLKNLQAQLIQLQNRVIEQRKRVVVIFEGGEFAGKGAVIRAFTEHLNPRSYRAVALPKPTSTEKEQWYFRRYISKLPLPGEIAFFDRSWYNRAVVEPVNGFCTMDQHKKFMSEVIDFERMLCSDGVILIKIFLSISKKTMCERIEEVTNDPLRNWELSDVDKNAEKNWNKFKTYVNKMFELTSTEQAEWKVIDSTDMRKADLRSIRYVLGKTKDLGSEGE